MSPKLLSLECLNFVFLFFICCVFHMIEKFLKHKIYSINYPSPSLKDRLNFILNNAKFH